MNHTARILVVDDDLPSCRLVAAMFRHLPYELVIAHDGETALAKFQQLRPDLVFLDVKMPGLSGLEVLRRIRAQAPNAPVIMLTGMSDVRTAVSATQLGAVDYLTKPFDADQVVALVRRELAQAALRRETSEVAAPAVPLVVQMGPSAASAAVIARVEQLASTTAPVLVRGERGAGKSLVARALHATSSAPFVSLRAAEVATHVLRGELLGQGRFARGGTVVLAEIADLAPANQAWLAEALAEGSPQLRHVATTSQDLAALAAAGRFDAQLLAILRRHEIVVPPLRDRAADLPHLARRFLDELRAEAAVAPTTIADGAITALTSYAWTENVRELREVIRRIAVGTTTEVISAPDVRRVLAGAHTTGSGPLRPLRELADEAAREAERAAILDALRLTNGNKSQAAKLLATDYKTLHVKMKQLGIDVDRSS